ncbi:MAG: Flp pilus assembly complex ATPase component TadA [Planctomycetaceae bacterium]|nr:Flp pilus assembly complex ATPase component TadA [Planctomycetaceae bacterium]
MIHLLDKSARLYTLTELGMPEETFVRFRRLISLQHGLLLVTGPTGSGKSTTFEARAATFSGPRTGLRFSTLRTRMSASTTNDVRDCRDANRRPCHRNTPRSCRAAGVFGNHALADHR